MINERRDSRMPISDVRKIVTDFCHSMRNLKFHEIDGDHFFMLTKRRECFDTINDYIDSIEARLSKH